MLQNRNALIMGTPNNNIKIDMKYNNYQTKKAYIYIW